MSTCSKYPLVTGFTLIECLTVVSLLAIFLVLTASFSSSLFARHEARNQVHAAAHAFKQDAERIRTLARTQKSTYSMVPICNNAWESGWRVIHNPGFQFDSVRVAPLWEKEVSTQVTTQQPPQAAAVRGSQFADVSLKPSASKQCNDARIVNHLHEKMRHLSFNAVGSASTKNGGFTANRVVFWSRKFPTIEYHVILSDAGRLRLCQPVAVNPKCSFAL